MRIHRDYEVRRHISTIKGNCSTNPHRQVIKISKKHEHLTNGSKVFAMLSHGGSHFVGITQSATFHALKMWFLLSFHKFFFIFPLFVWSCFNQCSVI